MNIKRVLSYCSLAFVSSVLAIPAAFAAHNYKGDGGLAAMAAVPPPPPMMGYKAEGGFDTMPPMRVYKDMPPPAPPVTKRYYPRTGLQSGFYVGLAGGYDSYRIRQDIANVNTSIGPTTEFVTTNPALATNGLVGGLFAGYGCYALEALYLGGEVFFNNSGARTWSRTTVPNTTIDDITAQGQLFSRLKIGVSYGVNLHPGVRLGKNVLVYGVGGYSRVRIETHEDFNFNGPSVLIANYNDWTSGYSYGIGLETLVMGNISLRSELVHSEYNSYKTGSNCCTDTGIQYSPSNNQMMFGILFHMG